MSARPSLTLKRPAFANHSSALALKIRTGLTPDRRDLFFGFKFSRRVSGRVGRGHGGCSAIRQPLEAVTSAAPQTCEAAVNFRADAGECNGLSVTPTNSVLSHPRAFFDPLSSRGGVALLEK